MEVSTAETEEESHPTTPRAFSCADMPISTANHTSVSQAPFSLRRIHSRTVSRTVDRTVGRTQSEPHRVPG
eukprot:6864782-Pyramimonas_sp.AAC.1